MGQSCNPASKRSSKMAPVVVSPSGKHTATLIFLHGLGDTGHGWASTLAEVRQSHVKIVCPTANTIPVTLNSGMIFNLILHSMSKSLQNSHFLKNASVASWGIFLSFSVHFLKLDI